MYDLDVVDSLFIDLEKRDIIQRLVAIGYTTMDIAKILFLDDERRALFVQDSLIQGTTINRLIHLPNLISLTTPEIEIQKMAESGNIDAFKELDNIRRKNEFNKLINEMDDDEFSC